MSDSKFRVVFEGEIKAGAAIEDVKKRLGVLFKLDETQVAQLFAGGKVFIRQNAPRDVCEKIRVGFQKAGAVCAIEPEPGSEADAPAPAGAAAKPAMTDKTRKEPAAPDMQACSVCGNPFAIDDLIRYKDTLICAECKPAFVQRLKEGAAVSSGALSGKYGSIDKALSGRFDFTIGAVLSEAWSLVRGSKLIIVGGVMVMYLAMFLVSLLLELLIGVLIPTAAGPGGPQGPDGTIIAITIGPQLLVQLVIMVITYPIMAGLFIIGIRRAANLPIAFSMIFGYYNRTIALVVLNVLYFILVAIGTMLLVIPGIYLAVAYMLAMPLLVEKKMPLWQAMETSRKTISKKWFKFFGFFLLVWLIVVISAIPLGIGLIWTVPLTTIAIGVLYRDVFGVEDAS